MSYVGPAICGEHGETHDGEHLQSRTHRAQHPGRLARLPAAGEVLRRLRIRIRVWCRRRRHSVLSTVSFTYLKNMIVTGQGRTRARQLDYMIVTGQERTQARQLGYMPVYMIVSLLGLLKTTQQWEMIHD